MGLLKNVSFISMVFFSWNVLSVNPLKCVSMNNLGFKIRPQLITINSNELSFYHLCVPDVVKNINVYVLNLMSTTNEKRHIKWHETCKCKCGVHVSVCNNKQRCDKNKCRSECKELTDKRKVS